jgi:hypothetical protein
MAGVNKRPRNVAHDAPLVDVINTFIHNMTMVQFKHCFVRVANVGYLETVFEDGSICPALLVEDEQARASAADLGYSNIQRMHVEHELSHTMLAEAAGLPYSPTLWNVAHPGSTPDEERALEEALVFSFQRFCTTGSRAPELLGIPMLDEIRLDLRILSTRLLQELEDREKLSA